MSAAIPIAIVRSVRDRRGNEGTRLPLRHHRQKDGAIRTPRAVTFAAVLQYLPKVIKGPLFQGDARTASKRLNRFLDEIGVADPRKVVHSLRHRAQDRLRAAGCPEDMRWAILGHEEETVAAGYGEGFPVLLLKQWIDKIGF